MPQTDVLPLHYIPHIEQEPRKPARPYPTPRTRLVSFSVDTFGTFTDIHGFLYRRTSYWNAYTYHHGRPIKDASGLEPALTCGTSIVCLPAEFEPLTVAINSFINDYCKNYHKTVLVPDLGYAPSTDGV